MTTEGVDYSTFPPSPDALKAAGKAFAVRYLARDSRGLDWTKTGEADALKAAGIDLVSVFESTAERALDGREAGQTDAATANLWLLALGLPATMPIYFAVDFDATPGQQAAIDDYFNGAGTILGAERVGVYGGYWIVSRCAANGSASWFWQTSAWSGGQWFTGNHIEQYAYSMLIDGTDCDLDRAVKDSYGQRSMYEAAPVPPVPVSPYPDGMDAGIAARLHGSFTTFMGTGTAFLEDGELSKLWLQGPTFGEISAVWTYDDAPDRRRTYWRYTDGRIFWRPNDREPIRRLGGKP